MGQKQGFFGCIKKFGHFSKNIWVGIVKNGCDQSGHRTLKLNVFQELNELMEWTDILHANANSGKLKVISMIFGWAKSKMDMANIVHETLQGCK